MKIYTLIAFGLVMTAASNLMAQEIAPAEETPPTPAVPAEPAPAEPAVPAEPAPTAPAEDATDTADGLFAVVKKIEGPASEIIVELPDGTTPDAKEGDKYPGGTEIVTGDATMIISLEGKVRDVEVRNSVLSIRPVSEVKIDRFLLSPKSKSVVTRLMVASGEVRVKITEERPDYSTDMQVSTPTATASVTGTDVQAIGYSANFGTKIVVASGSIATARSDGTLRNCGGGNQIRDGLSSALQAALTQGQTLAPIGMVAFEVQVGQLSLGGTPRSPSDMNNAGTNPVDNGPPSGVKTGSGGFDPGGTLPARSGRYNNRR